MTAQLPSRDFSLYHSCIKITDSRYRRCGTEDLTLIQRVHFEIMVPDATQERHSSPLQNWVNYLAACDYSWVYSSVISGHMSGLIVCLSVGASLWLRSDAGGRINAGNVCKRPGDASHRSTERRGQRTSSQTDPPSCSMLVFNM